MNILGIGPWEIVIILVIVLLVLGPEDLQKTGRTLGKWINKVTRSEGWMAMTMISRELRGLPARLAREAQLDELKDQIDIEHQIGSPLDTRSSFQQGSVPGEEDGTEKPVATEPPASPDDNSAGDGLNE